MSAPNTNIERQKRWHRPVLIGFGAVVAFAAIVFLLNIGNAVDGEGPLVEQAVGNDAQVLGNGTGN